MAKIETTATDLQWKSNMLIHDANDPASVWETDTKYPSAKAVANLVTTTTNAIIEACAGNGGSGDSYPVGSVVMTHKELAAGETSAAANPATLLGLPGTWVLVDKAFINKSADIKTLWTNFSAAASGSISWENHSICLKLTLTTHQFSLSPGTHIATIDVAKAGVTELTYSTKGGAAFGINSTGLAYPVKYSIHEAGQVTFDKIYGVYSADDIKNYTINLQTIIPISLDSMLDTACDKFYWKRVADQSSASAPQRTPVIDGLAYMLKDNNEYEVTGIGNYADADLTIPSSYNGLPVTSIRNYAFYDCDGLANVTIPDSITSIGDWAFAYCDGLASIDIPATVTNIGEYTFCGCNKLTAVSCGSAEAAIPGAPWGASNAVISYS